jgi:3-hydroxymyristoyl/3-hydroxydecanoyl-(acyl carrier protein) dehydratase
MDAFANGVQGVTSPRTVAGVCRSVDDFHTKKYLSPGDPVFAGHFPHLPIYPGVLLLDLMQRSVQQHAEQALGLKLALSEVVRTSFKRPVFPGATVTVAGAFEVLSSAVLRAQVRVESTQLVATARLYFKVVEHAS